MYFIHLFLLEVLQYKDVKSRRILRILLIAFNQKLCSIPIHYQGWVWAKIFRPWATLGQASLGLGWALGHFQVLTIGPGPGQDFCALGWAGPGPNQKTSIGSNLGHNNGQCLTFLSLLNAILAIILYLNCSSLKSFISIREMTTNIQIKSLHQVF